MKLTKLSNGTYINPGILTDIRLIGANDADDNPKEIGASRKKKIVIFAEHSEITIGPVDAGKAQGLIDELVALSGAEVTPDPAGG